MDVNSMLTLWHCSILISILVIYYGWRGYRKSLDEELVRSAQERSLRERVAYMLWIMAHRFPEKVREPSGEIEHAVLVTSG